MMAVLMPWLSDKRIEFKGFGRRRKSNPGVSSVRLLYVIKSGTVFREEIKKTKISDLALH